MFVCFVVAPVILAGEFFCIFLLLKWGIFGIIITKENQRKVFIMFTTKKFLSVPVWAVICVFVGFFSAAAADTCTVVYDCGDGTGEPVSDDVQNGFALRYGTDICAAPDEDKVFDFWETETGFSVHGGQLYDCTQPDIKLMARWRDRGEEISCDAGGGNYVKSGAIACDTPCTEGHYCPGGIDTFVKNGVAEQGIYECAPGYYAADDGQSSCDQCPEHYFAAGSGASSCDLCLGDVNADHTACDNSNLGGPVTCAAGKYLAAGVATCTDCPSGYFCPESEEYTSLASVNQGAYSCLSGGATNSDRKSCNVVLDGNQLLSGFANGEDCWLKPIENDEYKDCMFENVYRFN